MKIITAILLCLIVILSFIVSLADAQTLQPQIEWSKTTRISYGDDTGIMDITQTQDGGYAIVGYVFTGWHESASFSFFLIKIDQNAHTQWERTVGDKICVPFNYGSIKQTNDSGYILSVPANKLLKLDSQGTIEWTQNVTGEVAIQIVQGDFLVAGTNASNVITTGQLTKVDSSGSIIWTKTYQTTNSVKMGNIVSIPDGRCTYSGNFGTDFWLGQVDSVGNQLMNQSYANTIPLPNSLTSYCDLTATEDGGYAICGDNDRNSTICKVDSQGNIQWRNTCAVPYLQHIIQTRDGNIVGAGNNTLVITTKDGQNQGIFTFNMSIFKLSVQDNGFITYSFDYNKDNLIISKYTLRLVTEATPQPTAHEVTPQPTAQQTPQPTVPEDAYCGVDFFKDFAA